MDSSKINIPSISSLHDEKNTKEKARLDMFKIVLNKCIDKIIYTNRHTDKTFIIFEVPTVLIGYPLYDMKSCIVFLIQTLIKNKYYVEFIEPCYLYIDWGSYKSLTSIENVKPKTEIKNNALKFNEELIKKTLASPQIEFVYEDALKKKKKKRKDTKKKRH